MDWLMDRAMVEGVCVCMHAHVHMHVCYATENCLYHGRQEAEGLAGTRGWV